MDFDGSVNTADTEAPTEDKRMKDSVTLAITLSLLASRGAGGPKEKADELYSLFHDFLNATGYTVVKKEI